VWRRPALHRAPLTNVADKPEYAAARKKLRAELDAWMRDTADPRAKGDDDRWDKYQFFGGKAK
jgi:hypothetical protein